MALGGLAVTFSKLCGWKLAITGPVWKHHVLVAQINAAVRHTQHLSHEHKTHSPILETSSWIFTDATATSLCKRTWVRVASNSLQASLLGVESGSRASFHACAQQEAVLFLVAFPRSTREPPPPNLEEADACTLQVRAWKSPILVGLVRTPRFHRWCSSRRVESWVGLSLSKHQGLESSQLPSGKLLPPSDLCLASL